MDKKPAAGYVDMERKGMPGADGDEGQDQGSEGQCRSRSMGSYRAARDSRVLDEENKDQRIFNANLTAEEIAAVQLLRAQKSSRTRRSESRQ